MGRTLGRRLRETANCRCQRYDARVPSSHARDVLRRTRYPEFAVPAEARDEEIGRGETANNCRVRESAPIESIGGPQPPSRHLDARNPSWFALRSLQIPPGDLAIPPTIGDVRQRLQLAPLR